MANKATVNGFVLVYDRERVKDSVNLLNEIRNDFYLVDDMLYNSVMSIVNTKGFDLIENGNFDIDMRMPEKLVEQCRDTNDTIMRNISDMSQMIEGMDTADYIGTSNNEITTQLRRVPVVYGPAPVPKTGVSTVPMLVYGPAPAPVVTSTGVFTSPMLVYGPAPTPKTELQPIVSVTEPMLVYGPAPAPKIEVSTAPMLVYGPAPAPKTELQPIVSVTEPMLVYGPAPAPKIGVSTAPMLVYGPAPAPVVTSTGVFTSPMLVYGPAPVPGTDSTASTYDTPSVPVPNPEPTPSYNFDYSSPEYESIPNTAVGSKSLSDFIAPVGLSTVAGLAATTGIGIKRSKDKNKEEENEEEKK